MTWSQVVLTVVSTMGLYAVTVVASRLLGQRQFSNLSSYDLAFTFALGAIVGRGVLVVPDLSGAAVALVTMFLLHAGAGWLHHHVEAIHRFTQNKPILVVADGEVLQDALRRASLSHAELSQFLRAGGHASLDDVRAAILETSGQLSVIAASGPDDRSASRGSLLGDVVGSDRLRSADP